jgi:hypothetical protein
MGFRESSCLDLLRLGLLMLVSVSLSFFILL